MKKRKAKTKAGTKPGQKTAKKKSILHPGERWKLIKSLSKMNLQKKYAVTNHGRVISFTDDIQQGNEIKGSGKQGYPALNLRPFGGKASVTMLVHKIVAEYYLPAPRKNQLFVIHKDGNRKNNHPKNLRWVTKDEWWERWKSSKAVKKNLKNLHEARMKAGYKLKKADVVKIKKMLKKKMFLKDIAKKFDVSDMQISRIKSGENWADIKI